MAGYIPLIGTGRGMESRDPFDAHFFKSKFPDYLRQSCHIDESVTTIFEIVLTTGASIDVSHIIEIADDYMLVSAFLDSRTCEDTYTTYIRYDIVIRVNLIEEKGSRSVGFNVGYEPKVTANPNASAKDSKSDEEQT